MPRRKRNGEEITVDTLVRIMKEGADTYTLEVESVTVQSAGQYECTATNDLGTSSSSCSVNVPSKAGFDQKFKDQNVGETEDVEFTVRIHGDPKPNVTWYADVFSPLTCELFRFTTSVSRYHTCLLAFAGRRTVRRSWKTRE